MIITDIAQGPDGQFVACGLGGLIVMGRGDEWRVLDQGAFRHNLYSVTFHEDRVFVTSLQGLYELRDERLHSVTFGDTPPPTTAHIVESVRGALGLIGTKDLYLRNGDAWQRFD